MSNDPSQPPAEPDPLAPDLPVAAEQLPPSDDLTPVDSAGDPLVAEQGPVPEVNPVDPAGAPADQAAAGSLVTTPADALSPRPIEIAGVGAGTPPDASSVPPLDETSTSPFSGEQIRTGDNSVIVPLSGVDQHADAIADPNVPVVAAHEDPHGAAQAVLDQERPQADTVVPSRAEVMAQRVLDEGTLTPLASSGSTAPVETLDHHTVDPSGTADDSQPGAFVELEPTNALGDPVVATDADTSTVDLRVDPADRSSAKGQTLLPPELGEQLVTSSVKALAEAGFHRDLVHQWVDQAYADLQGQRNSAQSAGDDDPYPGLAI